ncbi:MAG: maleylpyruvate isomerase N-terminal domain-containing protein [Acidimicrobiia bacterium]|nr:maleylpyruvate isomerase N-terminal domain-containing protein [Acidimicrobiia bacterium]
MTNQTAPTDETATDSDLPVFPAEAPSAVTDPSTAISLLVPVLDRLTDVVDVPPDAFERPTPCRNFTVAELRNHVLAWLQFFAAALDDPDGESERIDPESWSVDARDDPAAIGEYIVHGWDLSVATGRQWSVSDDAAEQARLFLEGIVSPEYRGEDSGFFGEQIAVPGDAPMLERLLGFAGRNPQWTS